MPSNEQKLLLECIKYNSKEDNIKRLLNKDINFNYLFNLARVHGTETLLYFRLKEFDLEIGGKLSKYYYGNTARNILIYNELKNIVRIFSKNKIDFLIVKGCALAVDIYKNISLRQMSDIDILIREKDKERIKKILKNYRLVSDKNYEIAAQEFQYIKNFRDFNLLIEISWNIKHISTKDPSLFKTAKLIRYKDITFKTLDNEVNLIYLISHLREHHDYNGLNWLADLDWFINQNKIDYNKLIKEAKKYHKLNEIGFGLFLLKKYFNTSINLRINKSYYRILGLRYNRKHIFNLKRFKFDWDKKKIIDSFFKDNLSDRFKQLYHSIMQYFLG